MTIELRTCALCKQRDPVSDDDDGTIYLFKYSTRHFAHAKCLAERHGSIVALEMISPSDRDEFRLWIRALKTDAWSIARIRVLDGQTRAKRRREARP